MAQPSRRDFLALAAGAVSASERRRYADPATDLEVVRLTDPAFSSGMPAPYLRQFTRHSDSVVCWSERNGSRQIFITSLKTGESTQLTDAAALDTTSFSLAPDDRSVLYFDGPNLYETPLVKPAPRLVYAATNDRVGFSIAGDGAFIFGERIAGKTRVTRLFRQQTRRLFELDDDITDLMARPGNLKVRSQVLYRQNGALWVPGRALKTQAGKIGEALWTPPGHTLIYLHIPDDPKALVTLREHNPETGADTLLSTTSQFISAAPNTDASVFVSASRSVASPYVLITLRAARRELTLCEHHASDAAMVNPVFTPDSKTIVFVSDRHGKPAIYVMSVARFVEETATDN